MKNSKMKSIRFLFLVLASILSVSCEHEGLTPIETSDKIEKDIVVVDEGGESFVQSILNPTEHRKMRRRQIYEQTSSSYRG